MWSDVINVPDCNNKWDFNGYAADCRTHDDAAYGHVYSWMYITANGDTMCPAPWSVPAVEDFIALDKALGGNGERREGDFAIRDKYISEWGGQYPGYFMGRGFSAVGQQGNYWSKSINEFAYDQYNGLYGGKTYFLQYIQSSGVVNPQYSGADSYGLNLRCVANI
jgi:uncharacterized protein (TIGR02145 family)